MVLLEVYATPDGYEFDDRVNRDSFLAPELTRLRFKELKQSLKKRGYILSDKAAIWHHSPALGQAVDGSDPRLHNDEFRAVVYVTKEVPCTPWFTG